MTCAAFEKWLQLLNRRLIDWRNRDNVVANTKY